MFTPSLAKPALIWFRISAWGTAVAPTFRATFFSAAGAAFFSPPQPAAITAMLASANAPINNFFIIFHSFSYADHKRMSVIYHCLPILSRLNFKKIGTASCRPNCVKFVTLCYILQCQPYKNRCLQHRCTRWRGSPLPRSDE